MAKKSTSNVVSEEMLDSKEVKELIKNSKPKEGQRANRVKRVPISIRNVLKWDKQDPAYEYRWVNDNEDRIPRFKEAGWQVVESEEHAAGYRATGDPKALTTYVEKSVGSGTKAVLMRIDQEWYKEDQKTKQEEVDEIERSMDPRYREKDLEGQPESGWEGKIKINR